MKGCRIRLQHCETAALTAIQYPSTFRNPSMVFAEAQACSQMGEAAGLDIAQAMVSRPRRKRPRWAREGAMCGAVTGTLAAVRAGSRAFDFCSEPTRLGREDDGRGGENLARFTCSAVASDLQLDLGQLDVRFKHPVAAR